MSIFKRTIGFLFLIYFVIIMLPVTIIAALVVLILSPVWPRKYSGFMRFLARLWGKAGIRTTLSPVHVIDAHKAIKEPAVLINNHQSPFDIFAGLGYYPTDFLFFSKHEVFKIPFVGGAMRKLEYISVDRRNARAAANSTKAAIKKIKEGHRVLIYPEGSRSFDATKILPFKQGAFAVARKGGVAIQPFVIYGTQQMKPMTVKHVVFRHRLVLKVLDPIYSDDRLHPANENSDLNEKEKLEEMRKMIEETYFELLEQYGKKKS